MDIYPAREDPIPGVTSHVLLDLINNPKESTIIIIIFATYMTNL